MGHWWARRRAIHDNQYQSPVTTWFFINIYLEDLEIASSLQPNALNARLAQRARKWLPPAGTMVKFNVDGGLSRHGDRAAAAVICRDNSGCFLGASTVVFDVLIDASSLEAHAFNEALALAKDLNINRLVIGWACLEVMANIKRGATSAYAMVLAEIKHMRSEFLDVYFLFEHRECNYEAHSRVKAAVSLPVGRHM